MDDPPSPRDEATRARLERQRQRDTAPELALRRALHRRGLRFRVDRAPIRNSRTRADIVFGPAKLAVFVDGCFWHGCPEHATAPKNNAAWWQEKLAANRSRDVKATRDLERAGWAVVRVWEHEDSQLAADRIAVEVERRRSATRLGRPGDA